MPLVVRPFGVVQDEGHLNLAVPHFVGPMCSAAMILLFAYPYGRTRLMMIT